MKIFTFYILSFFSESFAAVTDRPEVTNEVTYEMNVENLDQGKKTFLTWPRLNIVYGQTVEIIGYSVSKILYGLGLPKFT